MPLQIVRFEDPIWRQPGVQPPQALVNEAAAHFQPPHGVLLLAYDPDTKERIIGAAGFVRVTGKICEARRVVVAWEHQKKGVGRQLMATLIATAMAAGYEGIRTQIPDNVPDLAAFFEKSGFHRSPPEFQSPGHIRLERLLA
jgi:GNAT superfamily N-acetyltransferase